MLGLTLAWLVLLAAGTAALPQSFVLDMGSIEGAVRDSPPAARLLNTTSQIPSKARTSHATAQTYPPTVPVRVPAGKSPTTTAVNSSTSSTCLPTTTVIVTLPNPTPELTSPSERSGENETENENENESENEDNGRAHNGGGTPFDTAIPDALSKWPHWFTAATFTLVFYDILTLGAFLWLWVFGYLWWFRRGGSRSGSRGRSVVRGWGWARRSGTGQGMEMVRMDMRLAGGYGEGGRYERTSEWVRTGNGYGRVRSESWGRARGAREAELEGEMRRLGMI